MTFDVLGLLEREHQRLIRGLDELGQAKQVRRRRPLFEAFRKHLRDHFRAEEKILFPRAQQAVLTRTDADLFAKGAAEHARQLDVLATAAKRLEDAEAVGALVLRLGADLRKHFEFEENTLFPAARRALGRSALLVLAETLEK